MMNNMICDMNGKQVSVLAKVRKAANNAIEAVVPKSIVSQIPLVEIFKACESAGLIPVDEAGERWSGLLCGADSRATIEFAYNGFLVKNVCLQISWHKFDTGRVEVVVYVG
jgi:hypothetical protein